MTDDPKALKKEINEIKFLIHDLRVARTLNEIIHYHVTLDADLEIHDVEQAQALHSDDLAELRRQAVSLRLAERDYQNAVRSFSPDKTILLMGKRYIRKVREISELILNPRWGRIDVVLSFLPEDSRSVQSRIHYRNLVRWIAGVHSRIEHFIDERRNVDLHAEFDIAAEIGDYCRNVIYGYLVEKSKARAELHLDHLEPAVLAGNRYRFRRMFFNLVMNAVDAMSARKAGAIDVSTVVEGDHVVLRVKDPGAGMTAEKIQQLLTDRESLDGELHSLGFVFVRQTVADFGGEIAIESQVGRGTTITVRLPYVKGARRTEPAASEWDEYEVLRDVDRVPSRGRDASAEPVRPAASPPPPETPRRRSVPAAVAEPGPKQYGDLVQADYRACEAQFPGSIFAIAITEDGRVDYFTHRPYERYFNISHEDLSPMFFEATVRGRLEEDDQTNPVLILKSPQNVREYFEFKEVPEPERHADRYARMVRNEYVRIARVLIETGLPPTTGVLLSDIHRFFGDAPELFETEPFPLERLARQELRQGGGSGA